MCHIYTLLYAYTSDYTITFMFFSQLLRRQAPFTFLILISNRLVLIYNVVVIVCNDIYAIINYNIVAHK